MSRVLRILARHFSLMVSLPKNSPELAQAAVKAGANFLKVHLNCHHHASGTTFGSWEQEKSAVMEVIKSVEVPVGMVTGEAVQPTPDELKEIVDAGFDFWDLFAKFAPPAHLALPIGRMVAVDSSWHPHLMEDLHGLGVHLIEGSIVPKTEYGTALNLVDLSNYSRLVKSSPMPVVIPTQKAIKPAEVKNLHQVGAAGLVIGAIVTGLEVNSLADATARFSEEIQKLPMHGHGG